MSLWVSFNNLAISHHIFFVRNKIKVIFIIGIKRAVEKHQTNNIAEILLGFWAHPLSYIYNDLFSNLHFP